MLSYSLFRGSFSVTKKILQVDITGNGSEGFLSIHIVNFYFWISFEFFVL